ncbi:MAG: head-tail connector protein [Candidatus Paracaedibacteraceae bacterium]|nr:head-tail connector protein [Candidatus Paracaedibacteraceae bacterium]
MLLLLETNAIEPISLTEVKSHLRLDTDDEDDLLNGLIVAATNLVEEYLGKTLIKKTWRIEEPGDNVNGLQEVVLPRGPLLKVLMVQRVMPNETYTNIRFVVKNHFSRPIVVFKSELPVSIVYEAGYGYYPKDVPAPIRHALFALVAHLYENRNGQLKMSELVKTLLIPYKHVQVYV